MSKINEATNNNNNNQSLRMTAIQGLFRQANRSNGIFAEAIEEFETSQPQELEDEENIKHSKKNIRKMKDLSTTNQLFLINTNRQLNRTQNNFNITENSVDELKIQENVYIPENSERRMNPNKLDPINLLIKSRDRITKFLQNDDDIQLSQKSKRFKKIKYRPSQIINNHDFIQGFIPKNKKLVGVLKRDTTGTKNFFPQYDFFLNEELKHIMSSKRKPCLCVSTYHIGSIQKPVSQLDGQYCGTVVSNITGSLWNFYDNFFGAKSMINATIFYQDQISLSFKPRSIQVYIISPLLSYDDLAGATQNKNLKQLYKKEENRLGNRIYKFINRKPVWDQKLDCWAMNFHGKAPIGSVQNMILVDQQNPSYQVMLLTQAADNAYNLQVSYPLSPRIAMAIANSSYDFKLLCQ